jgi:small-conductance mechanosensitive channel
MDGRLGIKHELHAEIHRLFMEAGVELAYPKQDLFLHNADEPGRGNNEGEMST